MKALRVLIILFFITNSASSIQAQAPDDPVYKFANRYFSITLPESFSVWTKDKNTLEELFVMLNLDTSYTTISSCPTTSNKTQCNVVKDLIVDYESSLELVAIDMNNAFIFLKINVIDDPSSLDPLPPEGVYVACDQEFPDTTCFIHIQDLYDNIIITTVLVDTINSDLLKSIIETTTINLIRNHKSA